MVVLTLEGVCGLCTLLLQLFLRFSVRTIFGLFLRHLSLFSHISLFCDTLVRILCDTDICMLSGKVFLFRYFHSFLSLFLTSCILVTRLSNRFYYTWRLFFRQYIRLASSSAVLFSLKLFISPGRTGGFVFAEETKNHRQQLNAVACFHYNYLSEYFNFS